MKYEEILKLLNAGYSRDEIMQMNDESGEPETGDADGTPEDQANGASDGAAELSAAVNEMKEMLSSFTKEITAMNIMNSRQQPESEKTADDIIANIISPTLNKKGD